jgi:hypothetical protein
MHLIDVTFDHRTDSNDKDPDSASPTLRRHHQELWSKTLPNGQVLRLEPVPGHYLFHSSSLGTFSLSSDTISNSIRTNKRHKHITNLIESKDLDDFQTLGSTVGATILFPGKKINNKLTINVARGLNSKIGDRIDLTLECLRLQYLGESNPLTSTLETYWGFFDIFDTFEQYVEFFLLQDLLENDSIKFFLPHKEGFSRPALPIDVAEYMEYKANTMNFVLSRNRRISEWATANIT